MNKVKATDVKQLCQSLAAVGRKDMWFSFLHSSPFQLLSIFTLLIPNFNAFFFIPVFPLLCFSCFAAHH